MNKQMNELIVELKEAGEDFEFYPTTRDMVRRIWRFQSDNHSGHYRFGKVLDIGCGKCDFRKWSTSSIEKQEIVRPWISTNTSSSRRAIS